MSIEKEAVTGLFIRLRGGKHSRNFVAKKSWSPKRSPANRALSLSLSLSLSVLSYASTLYTTWPHRGGGTDAMEKGTCNGQVPFLPSYGATSVASETCLEKISNNLCRLLPACLSACLPVSLSISLSPN